MANREAMIPVAEKKAEAIRRMKKLDYFSQSINAFRRSGYVMINEPPFGAHYYTHDDERLQQAIKEFEEENNALVYAVVRAFTSLGVMDSLLYVEDYREEWEYFDADVDYGTVMSYTINYDMPDCSEFGSIGFAKTIAGGLQRTA